MECTCDSLGNISTPSSNRYPHTLARVIYTINKYKANSWQLGIFLCMRCASIHRKLGTHVSKVKSLSMDGWSNEQVEVNPASSPELAADIGR